MPEESYTEDGMKGEKLGSLLHYQKHTLMNRLGALPMLLRMARPNGAADLKMKRLTHHAGAGFGGQNLAWDASSLSAYIAFPKQVALHKLNVSAL